MKFKRLVADFIDIILIMSLVIISLKFILLGIEYNNILITITKILFIIVGIFLIVIKDIQSMSIGKKIMKLQVINNSNIIYVSNTKIILRNVIALITMPISLMTIMFINKSIGDMVLNTNVQLSFNKNNIKRISILFIIPIIIVIIYLLFVFLLSQKLNYYSIRYLLIIFIVPITILLISVLLKSQYELRIILSVVISIIISYSLFNNYVEKRIIKHTKYIDAFRYEYPSVYIIKTYEYDDYAFIVFKGSNNNKIVHYIKEGVNCHSSSHPLDYKSNHSEFFVSSETYNNNNNLIPQIKGYDVIIDYIPEKNKTLIMLKSDLEIREFSDSLNLNYEVLNFYNTYYRIAEYDGKLEQGYYVTANGQICQMKHLSFN